MEPVDELPNPPPPGGFWWKIDEARKEMGWSVRELGRRAGVAAENHLTMIARRGTWNANKKTMDRFVEAFVREGMPRSRFTGIGSGGTIDTAALLDKAARSFARIAGISDDEAWRLARGVQPTEFSYESYLEALLKLKQTQQSPPTEPPRPRPPPKRSHTPRPGTLR